MSLPAPDSDALAASHALQHQIAAEIARNDGAIPFVRFMELALYAPDLGYYSGGAAKLGKDGDFTTAPEISPLFGATLAHVAAAIMAQTAPRILEFGAGTGKREGLYITARAFVLAELVASLHWQIVTFIGMRNGRFADYDWHAVLLLVATYALCFGLAWLVERGNFSQAGSELGLGLVGGVHGQANGGQNADDCHDDQQLDQGRYLPTLELNFQRLFQYHLLRYNSHNHQRYIHY